MCLLLVSMLQTLLYLYAFKLAYPDRVTLLRSQRETRLCAKTTFKRECEYSGNRPYVCLGLVESSDCALLTLN